MTVSRTDILLRSAAVGAVSFALWKIYCRQKRLNQIGCSRQNDRDALLNATHGLEVFTADIAASVRAGSLNVGEGVDKLVNDSVHAVLGPLKKDLMTSKEPEWVFLRHLLFDITRVACMPRVPRGTVKYVDFETGGTHIMPSPPRKPPDSKRFVVVSDTHMRHRDVDLPSGDVLLHCGDVFNFGGDPDLKNGTAYQRCFDDFLNWLREQRDRCPEVVFIGGNHDAYFENKGSQEIAKQLPSFVTYLCDSGTLIAEGIRVYGTAFSYTWRKSGNSAFQTGDKDAIRLIMDSIPEHLDVLMTHGPPQILAEPFGLSSRNTNTGNIDFAGYGSDDLTATVQNRVKPRVHVFGHVHDAHGATRVGETLYISASSVSSYKTTAENPPLVFDLPARL